MEVLELFNNICSQSILLSNGRLIFEFDTYDVLVNIELSEEINVEEFQVNLAHTENKGKFQQLLSLPVRILDLFIASSEYLGHRKDNIDFQKSVSICRRMYRAIDVIKKYNWDIIDRYVLNQNEGFDKNVDSAVFCGLELNYIFEIHIKEEYHQDLEFFTHLLENLQFEDSDLRPPYFYWGFYNDYKKIEDSKIVSIVNTNTKARRLGYLKLLIGFISQQDRISANYINKKFEKFTSEYEDELNNYKNNKGLIKITKSGISAKPYINLAKELKLINLQNNIYSSGKTSKVYKVLKNEFNEQGQTFYFSRVDKLFFLETIIREDFLYISSLLELIKMKKKIDYGQLVAIFQRFLLERLREYLTNLRFKQYSKSYKKIKTIEKRINKWKEADVYLEHILMPRFNWLYDLELLEMDSNLNVWLTESGIKLFNNFCYWNDINWTRNISPNEFLNLFSVHIFDNIYHDGKKLGGKNQVSKDEINKKVIYYLGESFNYFQTLAPNRVTASQAITYTKYKLYLADDIKVGHRYIANFLESNEQRTFVYKFQKQYGDGYIQKI